MLKAKGFKNIYNLSGGIKAWGKEVAVGPEDSGLHLFAQVGNGEEAIVIGFGLEMGLRDFYLSMQKKVAADTTKALFEKLADIEILHQEKLVQLYNELTETTNSVVDFAEKIAEPVMEGGMTTDEYLLLFKADLDSELEVLGMALSIEAQALDLYSRAAATTKIGGAKNVLQQIANDERNHITMLSAYIDNQKGLK
jgi:rubrerythrin